MKDLTFYRAWLLAPMVVPLPGMLLGVAGVPAPPEPWLGLQLTLTFSLLVGCIVYLPLAAALWQWLPGQPPWRVRLAALLAPLPMLLANAVLPWMGAPAGLVALIAYGYVAACLASDTLGRVLGWIRPAAPTAAHATASQAAS